MEYSKKEEFIKYIMLRKAIPSTKLALIALVISDKPLTTAELNNMLNVNKNYQDYSELFRVAYDTKVISLVEQKDYRGCMRKHFIISEKDFDNFILNNPV